LKTWLTSLDAAITLSALALLSFIAYCLMEMRYFLGKWIPGDSAAAVEALIILLIAGGWLRSLFVASNGRRGGLLALLILGGFSVLIAFYDVRFFPLPWPEQTAVIAVFLFPVISIIALALQFGRKKPSSQ
jgi:hypothetical protein